MEVKFAPEFFDSMNKLFSPWGRFKEWVYINNPIRNARKIWQRGTRGYANEDLWSLNSYLGTIIYKSLRAWVAKEPNGHPVGLEQEDWEETLTEISDGFYDLVNLDNIQSEITTRHRANATGKKKEPFFGVDTGNEFGNSKEKAAWMAEINAAQVSAEEKANKFVTNFLSLWD